MFFILENEGDRNGLDSLGVNYFMWFFFMLSNLDKIIYLGYECFKGLVYNFYIMLCIDFF